MSTAQPEMPSHLGRYELIRQLGRGAMGVVYEGIDPNIGRRVAIKTARRDVLEASGRADEMIERFLREARAAGNLNHPHIITIYDADEQNGTAYIAMELIEGTDLQKLIDSKGRFTPEETVALGATVCEALAHAHTNGVVHRDVKPSNIMMLDDGSIRVADFGIARVQNSSLTQEGAMIGTPHYMSPEQFMGQRADGRSDLFSVGIILYELLTGEKPFHGEAISTVMHAVIKTDPIEPRELNFSVNGVLSEVIMKSLAKNPNNRYADGRDMAAALRESLKEKPSPFVTLVGDASTVGEKTMVVDGSGSSTLATLVMDESGARSVTGGSMSETVADERVEPGSVPAPERVKAKPMPWGLIGGGIAALAVVAIALFAMMPGSVRAYSFTVEVGYVDEIGGDPVFSPGGEIHIFKPDKVTELASKPLDVEAQIIDLKTSVREIFYVISRDGYEPTDGDYRLDGPDEDAYITHTLYATAVKKEMDKQAAE